MKRLSLLKIFVVIGLSLLLILNLHSVVLSDDDFDSSWVGPDVINTTNNTTEGGSLTSTEEDDSFNTTDNSANESNSSIGTGNTTTSLNTTTNDLEEEDDDDNDVNSLAYTGAGDNTTLAVVIVLGAVVAGYSLKKVRDYKGL